MGGKGCCVTRLVITLGGRVGSRASGRDLQSITAQRISQVSGKAVKLVLCDDFKGLRYSTGRNKRVSARKKLFCSGSLTRAV
jgi:hypothetical protein